MQDRYQWLFRKSPVLAVSLDEDGYFIDASDAWLERFGYSRSDIGRLRPQDLASPTAAQRIVEDYLPLLRRTGRLRNVPVDLRTKSGELVDFLATVVVEKADGEEYVRTVAVYSEVGEQAQIE